MPRRGAAIIGAVPSARGASVDCLPGCVQRGLRRIHIFTCTV